VDVLKGTIDMLAPGPWANGSSYPEGKRTCKRLSLHRDFNPCKIGINRGFEETRA
jgi:hypothetical protein